MSSGGNAWICASSEIIECRLRSSVSFRELNKFVMKGNHGSPKYGSSEKTTTVVGSHWKVIRAIRGKLAERFASL